MQPSNEPNFLAQFKEKMAAINEGDIPKPRYDTTELSNVLKTPLKAVAVPKLRRYNIHKRSLPEGMDIVVMFNVTKLEADWMIQTKLKTKMLDFKDKEVMIYYDPVPTDADAKERSIYYNERPVTKDETEVIEMGKDDDQEPILLGSDSQWVD